MAIIKPRRRYRIGALFRKALVPSLALGHLMPDTAPGRAEAAHVGFPAPEAQEPRAVEGEVIAVPAAGGQERIGAQRDVV